MILMLSCYMQPPKLIPIGKLCRTVQVSDTRARGAKYPTRAARMVFQKGQALGIGTEGRRLRLVPYSFEFGGFPSPNS